MKTKLILFTFTLFFLSACSFQENSSEQEINTQNDLAETNESYKSSISFAYNSDEINISYQIPDSWEEYWYSKEILDEDWVIRFLDNNDFMIVNLSIYTIEEWEEQKQEWLFNNEKLLESENYVISYSETLDMPYEDEDDIQIYSNMLDDVSYFLDSVELNY